VKSVLTSYQRGDRIVFEYTTDPHAGLQPGDKGTFTSYDRGAAG